MAKRKLTFAEICDDIRSYWRNAGTSGSKCVLLRTGSHGFIETNEDEIAECVKIIARQPATGEPFNALEKLAFRMLCEGMGLNPYTGEYDH
jgi:hypothetical protein